MKVTQRVLFAVALGLILISAGSSFAEDAFVTLSASASPAMLGTSVDLTGQVGGDSLGDGVDISTIRLIFERSEDSASGVPVAAGNPGATWKSISLDGSSVDSRRSASVSINTADYGVGTYGFRVRLTRPGLSELLSELSLQINGQ